MAVIAIVISTYAYLQGRRTLQTLAKIHPEAVSIKEATRSSGWISRPIPGRLVVAAGEEAIFLYPVEETTTKIQTKRTEALDTFRRLCPQIGNDEVRITFQKYKLNGRECEAAFFTREPNYLIRNLRSDTERF